jgi:catechol 2,3-dioxygenase-like lactoylglutathione lyase family enzyme
MPRMIYNMQTMLQVRDLPASVAFYTDVLGFKVEGTFPDDAPTWAGLYSGNARMMLTQMNDGEPTLTGQIYMYPDDLDAAWKRLREAAPVVEPPVQREYGMREFSIRDPDGYLITFGANTGEPHEHPHAEGDHDHPH